MNALLLLLLFRAIQVDPVPPPIPIETERDAALLCAVLTPVERMRYWGDAIERGQAEMEYRAMREKALLARYRVTIPGERLVFQAYVPGDDEYLTLSMRTAFAAVGGRLQLWPGRTLPVEVNTATAKRILEAQNRGELSLVLTFEVSQDDDQAQCMSLASPATYTLHIEPVAWEYVSGGTVLARGGE
jgi:hypothetical protein